MLNDKGKIVKAQTKAQWYA